MANPPASDETIRPRLLFVDRSRLMRRAADRILGGEFQVLLAEDCEQGWIALLDDPLIQVVFHDLGGPEGSDFSLLQRIRQSDNRRIRDTPVVVLTDDDDSEEHRAEALESGATDFIDKPFRPSELIARARSHATTSDAAQRLRLMQRHHNKDGDTGLGNRRYFFERLAQALSFAKRQHQSLSLVHLHLEGMIDTLDAAPPAIRKERLVSLGKILARAVRHEDTVYRTGPESFSFILPGTNDAGAEAVRCRIAPELDGIGMLSDASQDNGIVTRFIVQTPGLKDDESTVDCLRRIREGMGPLLLTRPHPSPDASSPHQHQSADELEALLEMARHGDATQLKEHLPELIARLKPLLDLAHESEQGKPSNATPSRRVDD